ncbi:hypothetical protein CPB86DRAFT_871145 [Serendipita vermifera]|nr:hypothetical protein CPB86DRAFT_871145 [Serendipita vermifera]
MPKARMFLIKYLPALGKKDPPIVGPPKLPTELLIEIINFVEGKKELYRLCRTSRLLRTVAEPLLYARHFGHSELAKKMDIRVLFRHPHFETIINTISLKLIRWNYCQHLMLKGGYKPHRPLLPCSCREFDEAVGRALNCLLNLRVLRLYCSLCQTDSQERHGYISTLNTRVLQEVKFSCYCSIMDEKRVAKCLSAPCMTSVTTLGWHSLRGTSAKGGYLESLLVKDGILPNLSHLRHWGDDISNLLLRYRPITQLSSTVTSDGIPRLEDLKRNDGLMTHMSIYAHFGASEPLFNIIAQDPSPFRNLQHIGTLILHSETCLGRCNELYINLSRFVILERLVSIDARYNSALCAKCHEYLSIFQAGLPELSKLFPHLRRVLLRRPDWLTDVWVLSQTWECVIRECSLWTFDLIHDSESLIWDPDIPIVH